MSEKRGRCGQETRGLSPLTNPVSRRISASSATSILLLLAGFSSSCRCRPTRISISILCLMNVFQMLLLEKRKRKSVAHEKAKQDWSKEISHGLAFFSERSLRARKPADQRGDTHRIRSKEVPKNATGLFRGKWLSNVLAYDSTETFQTCKALYEG